jgi:hypothetical protein
MFTIVEIDDNSKDRCASEDSKQVVGFAIWNFTSSQKREREPILVDLLESEGNWAPFRSKQTG